MGLPRFGEVLNRPLYPVHLILVAMMPTLVAWHWITVVHVLLKLAGLVLLGVELGWPMWLTAAASAGAMLTHGALSQFSDVIDLAAAAWLPLQLWLTVKAVRSRGWSGWDALWVVCAALRLLGSNPNRVIYYEVLILGVTAAFAWGRLRSEAPRVVARYAVAGLLVAPLLLPAFIHFADSARSHFLEFEDWHFRRAYNWRNYWLRLPDLTQVLLVPWGLWLVLAAALALASQVGPLVGALGGYLGFALLHTIRYAPFWFLLAAFPGVRIPQKAFEPLTWLVPLALADVAAVLLASRDPGRRWAAIVLVVAGVAFAAWDTPLDPREAYVLPRWTRPLPERLAATIRAEPRARVLLSTGVDRARDQAAPLLNSNHNFFLGIASARFFGDVPPYAFMRATYRVPGLMLIQRMPTPVGEWEAVVDLYAELGIRWVLWDGNEEPLHPRLRLVDEEHGFRLYEIAGARSLIYALPALRSVERPRAPSGVVDLIYTLPTAGPFCYGCPPVRGANARIDSEWAPGLVRAEVDASGGAWVVLSEGVSRGWRTTLDGRATPSYQVNEAFQGVWVPAGRHEVVWRFTEPAFFVGFGLAALGVVLLAALPVAWRRRAR